MSVAGAISSPALFHEVRELLRHSRAPRLRGMREFAEREIVIPDGPFENRRFRVNRQPYARLWLDEVDSGRWARFASVGPTQSGKTLLCFVIPTMYHLFELGETVICGLPSMDMAGDKWREDLLPAIQASRYHKLLPDRGPGSRGGGNPESIQFRNGATLKFMSGGGSDKKRAAFTARVIVITEVDGLDEAGGASREADKVTQIEARARAYGNRKRVYLECTVSIEEGRIWQEYSRGTHSRIVCRCPHCRGWVTPERTDLRGWREATSQLDASEAVQWLCPSCERAWSEGDRRLMNEEAVMVHDGQELAAGGKIRGDVPRVDTFSFRWNAFNNLFWTGNDIGADEWRAANALDEENAEREMCQFVWAVPPPATAVDINQVDRQAIQARTTKIAKGIIPEQCGTLTVGIDLGGWLCWWIAIAWADGATPYVVDYGRLEVPQRELGGIDVALWATLRSFRDDVLGAGWQYQDGKRKLPDAVWIDSKWQSDVAYGFASESGKAFLPYQGFGVGQQRRLYTRPRARSSAVRTIGEHYHIVRLRSPRIDLVHVDADYWKSFLHARIAQPVNSAGGLRLFAAPTVATHAELSRHWTAEQRVETFDPKKGVVISWERISRKNHWFDAAYAACAAAHHTGVRLQEAAVTPPLARRSAPRSLEEYMASARGGRR